MSKKTGVMLPTRGQFRRTVRKDGKPVLDDAGNPRVLTFSSGQPVELTAEELEAVRDDIGNVLRIVKMEGGKPTPKVDGKATALFQKETADMRARGAEKSKPAPKPPPAPTFHKSDFEKKDK